MNQTLSLFANSSEQTQTYETKGLAQIYKNLNLLASVIEIYVNKSMLGFGVLFNLFLVVVIIKQRLVHRFYSYLWCRLFCNLIVCLFAVISWTFPLKTDKFELYKLAYLIYERPCVRVAIWAATLSKIFMITYRYFIIIRKTSFLCNLSKKANLSICFGTSIIVGLPIFLAFRIQGPDDKNMYNWDLSEWGNTLYFKIYILGNYLLDSVVPLTAHLVFTILSVRKFDEIMKRKAKLQTFQQLHTNGVLLQAEIRKRYAYQKADMKFARCITLLCVISLAAYTTDTLSGLLERVSRLELFVFIPELSVISNMFRQIAFTILYSVNVFEGFVFLKMDSNLMNAVRQIVRIKKGKTII